jgi:hypothetical protein
VPRGQPRSSGNQISWLEVKHTLHWPATGTECGSVCQMKEHRVKNYYCKKCECSLCYAVLWAVMYLTQLWMWLTVVNLTMLSVQCLFNETDTFTFLRVVFSVAWHHPI